MPVIVIVEKVGTFKSTVIKNYIEEELYKKAGFKSPEGFKVHTNRIVSLRGNRTFISLYGKIQGRAGQENKYEFPPPVDKVLFFGNCLLVAKNVADDVVDLSSKEWEVIYEQLYGGFEDIGDEDTEDEEEDDDEGSDIEITKSGYQKDGFVVDDNDIENDEEEDDDYEDIEEEEAPKPKSKSKSKTVAPAATAAPKRKYAKKASKEEIREEEPVQQDMYFDCASELSEESYIE
jgi:hypothetical protein